MWMKFFMSYPNRLRTVVVSARQTICFALTLSHLLFASVVACQAQEQIAPFVAYLTGNDKPALVAFNPSFLDPRKNINVDATVKAGLRDDLKLLRAAFDGLVLYEFQPDLTPAILDAAKQNGFQAILLGIGNPKSKEEILGIAKLVSTYHQKLALAIVVGNEGLIENRYSIEDVQAAAVQLKNLLPKRAAIPLTTSEPIAEYGRVALREFGDFLAPNIHPAIDQEGIDPKAGVDWVKQRASSLASFATKPVLVKETGLPHGGAALYSPAVQDLFWQAYLSDGLLVRPFLLKSVWISYAVAFEAFDMQWKAEKIGQPIEGHWGLVNNTRQPYPAFDAWRMYKQATAPEKNK
jgi:exo-beta-1,3-glucanase (GH17 family)